MVIAANECIETIIRLAIPAFDKCDGGKPASRLRATRQQLASHGCQRTNAIECQRFARPVRRVSIKDDASRVGTVVKAGKEILVTISIDVEKSDRQPAAILVAARQLKKLTSAGEPASCH